MGDHSQAANQDEGDDSCKRSMHSLTMEPLSHGKEEKPITLRLIVEGSITVDPVGDVSFNVDEMSQTSTLKIGQESLILQTNETSNPLQWAVTGDVTPLTVSSNILKKMTLTKMTVSQPKTREAESSQELMPQKSTPKRSLSTSKEVEKDDGLLTAQSSAYERLHLGLLMTIINLICNNIKLAIITTIWISTFLSSFDTSSDLFMTNFYLSQGLTTLAIMVMMSDYLPGIVVLMHHINSENWKVSSLKDKCLAVLALACHPFSLLMTNIMWLLNIFDEQSHRLARLSAILHGGIEAPLQFLVFVYGFSKGIIPLPWINSTSIVDRNDNILSLGKLSILSLVLTTISLLKSANDTFEIISFVGQLFATVYALINLIFRLLSIGYVAIYLEIFAIPFLVITWLAIYLILMRQHEKNKHCTSTISTMAVAIFLPICISRSPERFQIREPKEIEEKKKEIETNTDIRKRLSVWISIITNPIILLADTTVYILLQYTEFNHDNVWSNKQMVQFYGYFLCPMFLLAMLASISFYPLERGNNFGERMRNKAATKLQKLFTILSLIGVIVVTILFTLSSERLDRTSGVFVSQTNELVVVEAVSNGPFSGCNDAEIPRCENITVRDSNFRTTNLIEGTWYVSPKINLGTIEDRKTAIYKLNEIEHWKIQAPTELTDSSPHCKRCLVKSVSCDQLLDKITDVQKCEGKLLSLSM